MGVLFSKVHDGDDVTEPVNNNMLDKNGRPLLKIKIPVVVYCSECCRCIDDPNGQIPSGTQCNVMIGGNDRYCRGILEKEVS
jgi:hypothetical protein